MSYLGIDPVIASWAKKNSFTLFTSQGEREIRAIYTSSQRGECFQIWIDAPDDGQVSIHAAEVETIEDKEFKKDWKVEVSEIGSALEEAFHTVKLWMSR